MPDLKATANMKNKICPQYTVSIAIATYNGSRFIADQIASIVNQTRLPDEIVISDDCSTDDTIQIIDNILRSLSIKFKVVKNASRLGWRRNFINVMDLCECDLIAFCDQDDVWELSKIENLVSIFASSDTQMVYHNATLIDETGEVIGSLNAKARDIRIVSSPLSMDFWTPIFGFSMIFRRELISYSMYWNESIDKLNREEKAAHDQWIFFLSSILGNIVYADTYLVRYRIHGKNSVGLRVSSKKLQDYYIIYKNSVRKLNDRNLVIKNRLQILNRMIEDQPLVQSLRTASAAYELHLEFNERRIRMYHQPRIYQRLTTFLSFHRKKMYSSETLPLSQGEKLRDLVVAVLGV